MNKTGIGHKISELIRKNKKTKREYERIIEKIENNFIFFEDNYAPLNIEDIQSYKILSD